jgi:hypothetical protein
MIKSAAKAILRRMIAKMEDDVEIRTQVMIDTYGTGYTMEQENKVMHEVEVLKDVISYLLTDLTFTTQDFKALKQAGAKSHGQGI